MSVRSVNDSIKLLYHMRDTLNHRQLELFNVYLLSDYKIHWDSIVPDGVIIAALIFNFPQQ